jgi:hypothetical protein
MTKFSVDVSIDSGFGTAIWMVELLWAIVFVGAGIFGNAIN